jgi:hypothetical protein
VQKRRVQFSSLMDTEKKVTCKGIHSQYKISTGLQELVKVKVKHSITGLDRLCWFQKAEAPRFQENRHMNVVRLSALHTGRLYPTVNISGIHFC